jgi:hypothetical protein
VISIKRTEHGIRVQEIKQVLGYEGSDFVVKEVTESNLENGHAISM